MKGWEKSKLNVNSPISKAVKILNKYPCVLISNEKNELIGTITDRDVRNRILQKNSIKGNVSEIMNKNPKKIFFPIKEGQLENLKKNNDYRVYPLVDSENKLVGIYTHTDIQDLSSDNLVFIMAGGLGTRLGDMTKDCPKPLLRVGNKTILETIIQNFKIYGYTNFVISINYFGEMIKNYFQDGENFGVSISYIKEDQPLGTGGSLSLLKKTPKKPIFLINGDILTKLNFQEMLEFHKAKNAKITVGICNYNNQIPYGVFEVDKMKIISFAEKPSKTYLINAGVYIINPEIIDNIPKNKFLNITDIINKLLKKKDRVFSFPIHEYWVDIGKKEDFIKADNDYEEVFSE